MKTLQEVIKPAMLISPHRLPDGAGLIQTLRIIKNAAGQLRYETSDTTQSELKFLFPGLSRDLTVLLREFEPASREATIKEIKQRHFKQKAGVAYPEYLRNALLRHYHLLLERLKPYLALLKWYHTKPGKSNHHFSTAPCVFSAYRPQLSFEVVADNGQLRLVTSINVNGACFPLDSFARQHYLLESNNELFILHYKDYQTIEWLRDQPVSFSDASVMINQLLSIIEKDYSVNRNDHFNQQVLAVEPVKRVMLSELSNTFLMLTPQWLYDGFLIEGSWQDQVLVTANSQQYIIRRDKVVEEELVHMLEGLHPNFSKQRNGYYYLSFADAQKKQWFLKTYHRLLVSGIELTGMDMLKHFRYSAFTADTTLEVIQELQTSITIRLRVRFGEEAVQLGELQKMLIAGQHAVLLGDGTLGVLGADWMEQYAALIKHGKAVNDTLVVPRWLMISIAEKGQREVMGVKRDWWQRWKNWQSGNNELYPLPPIVKATLRPYQQKGYEWMMLLAETSAGGCLADDMGLGKTLQSICFLAARVAAMPMAKHLIVCPSSLIYNWQQELAKFTPAINSVVYHGAQRDTESLSNTDIQLVITSFGTLRADADHLLSISYATTIIDESHNIKNPTAQITRVINNIQSQVCFALSGTPVVNNTVDIWSQLNVVVPGLLGNREFFKREYADAIDRDGDAEKIIALQRITAPFILRRTKEQAAPDLPEKTESILWCEMGAEQRELYEEVREQIRGNLFLDISNQGLAKSKLAVLQGILKLRQVCNSPLLLPDAGPQRNESIKTTILFEELKNILPTHRVLVFSQFSSMLNILADECRKQNIAFFHFDGQTPPQQRASMVEAFQQPDCTEHLFLISLKAGNTGLTLTAADYVFLFDPWWNTAVEQQAIDRTHRIGQTKNVFAYKMICRNSIEEKIIRLQERKKQLADELVTADEGFVKSLSEEDIAFLFG